MFILAGEQALDGTLLNARPSQTALRAIGRLALGLALSGELSVPLVCRRWCTTPGECNSACACVFVCSPSVSPLASPCASPLCYAPVTLLCCFCAGLFMLGTSVFWGLALLAQVRTILLPTPATKTSHCWCYGRSGAARGTPRRNPCKSCSSASAESVCPTSRYCGAK